MEFLVVIGMIAGGVAMAVGFLALAAMGQRGGPADRASGSRSGAPRVAVSILHAVARAGGADAEAAARLVLEHSSHRGVVERGVDVRSWAEAFAVRADENGRRRLLESAVRIAVAMHPAIPLDQYNVLVDLTFGLGFHADALARLRARYRFEYVDYAKRSRPREADPAGGGARLFQRAQPGELERLRRVLGLDEGATHQDLVSTYRRLASLHHPDRYHDAPVNERQEAARRFIELTEAYEKLLTVTREGGQRG